MLQVQQKRPRIQAEFDVLLVGLDDYRGGRLGFEIVGDDLGLFNILDLELLLDVAENLLGVDHVPLLVG